jgi:enamine deaminase RidA (YjgF/YER057c/UK114 family)
MDATANDKMSAQVVARAAGAEQKLKELGIQLPAPPEPFGTYVEAAQTGNVLFLSAMLPREARTAKYVGRVGAELDVESGRKAAQLAALNVLAAARKYSVSLDKVARVVRLGVSVATSGDMRDQPKVADGASELQQNIYGKIKTQAAWFSVLRAFRWAFQSPKPSSTSTRSREPDGHEN